MVALHACMANMYNNQKTFGREKLNFRKILIVNIDRKIVVHFVKSVC